MDETPKILTNDLDNLDDIHSIQRILARPALITEMVLESTAPALNIFAPQVPILEFGVPGLVLEAANKISKVQNFEYFRATTHLKVMVNANPFTCGKLWVCYSPLDNLLISQAQLKNKSRTAVTSYPGVELDLQVNNTVELDVPWTALQESALLSEGSDLKDTLFSVFAMGPIRGPAGFKVNIQVFGWLTDIVLRGPTFRLPPPVANARYQINTDKKKEAKGPITQVSGFVGKTAGLLKKIPFLTEYAAPVEWAANAVEGVASIFGFSRPVEGSGAGARSLIPGRGMCQNVCEDQSVVLAYSNDNTLNVEPVFLVPEDEMDVEYICNRPGLIDVLPYSTTSPSLPLMSYNCGAAIDVSRSREFAAPPRHSVEYTPTCFENVAQTVSNYRADIVFLISFAKTAFHTGRVEIVFSPGPYAPPIAGFDTSNCYRTIIDLSLQNEIEFICPYVSNYETLFTDSASNALSLSMSASKPFGWITIKPLTPLLCPDSVSQTIDVYIWKYARNVAFAGTADTGLLTAVYPAATRQINLGVKDTKESFTCYTDTNTPEHNQEVLQRVCGEQLLNIRPLTRAHRFAGTMSTADDRIIRSNISVNDRDYLGFFSGMYVYFRGGISYKFVFNDEPDKRFSIRMETHVSRVFAPNGTDRVSSTLPVRHVTFSDISPIHEVQVPFYAATRRLLCNFNDEGDPLIASNFMPSVYYSGPISQKYRAGKDDFSFGCLVGPTNLIRFWTV